MTETYTYTGQIDEPVERVWGLLRDFGDSSWMGIDVKVEGSGVGAVRTFESPGGTVSEQCERLDEAEMVVGYTVVEGDLGVCSDYHATITVRPASAGATELTWTATYEPTTDTDTMAQMLGTLYPRAAEGIAEFLRSTR